MKKYFPYAAFIAIVISITGCASKKNGQSYVGKVYHNTTAHYNGYYYATLKMKENENVVAAGRQEDYEKLLPIFLTGNSEDNFSSSDMDSIIKRLTVVVKLHPKSKWTDDAYFNIGKAYFYKKDYESAMATFQFVSSEFKDDNASSSSSGPSHSSSHKKKKHKPAPKSKADKNVNEYTGTVKEQSQSSGFKMLRHKPIHYSDVLWLVRATAMDKNYGQANAILNYLDEDKKFPSDLKDQLQLMHAFVFIQQKQYKNAVDPMIQALKYTKNKKGITRYTYILAQLYQLSGDYGSAGKTFTLIPKLHPSYAMDFNSRISVVKNYVASGSGSPSQIITDLQQMAKNQNFEEFYDQIYYYIGLVELKQGKDDRAVKSFETSIEKSVSNINQKGLSFLTIGEMSMAEHDYITAAPYYDSAVVFLNTKFDTLQRVKRLGDVLNNVTAQTAIITSQDSLQRLASLPEKERGKILDQMADRMQKQQESDASQTSNVTNVFNQDNSNQNQSGTSNSSTWYFYNTTLRASGYNEFIKKWGNRTNEDNWRRGNKKSGGDDQASGDNAGQGNGTQSADKGDAGSAEGGLYKQLADNIPTTPEKLRASDEKIMEAYNTLGNIYNNDLNNTAKAIETFEKLTTQYSGDTAIAKSYYSLFLLYEEVGNRSKAENIRQTILSTFPTSVYAAVLLDPDYFKKQQEQKNAVNKFYASTYDTYEQEQFSDVFARVKEADSLFVPNPLQAKFDLLQAFSIGKTEDRNAFIVALDSLIKKFPGGEEHDKAVEILTALGAPPKGANQQKEEAKVNDKLKGPSPYKFAPGNPHYFVVYFNMVTPKSKGIADSISNYNTKNHSNDNLKVQPQLLDKNSQMIVVKQFKNKDDAMDYYDDITDSETLFESVEDIGYRVFVIDDKNFIQFFQRKNMDEYIDFFEKNYENGGED